jgi:hypothetical protein
LLQTMEERTKRGEAVAKVRQAGGTSLSHTEDIAVRSTCNPDYRS